MKRWIVPLVLGLTLVGAIASRAVSSASPTAATSGCCPECDSDHCPMRR
jgi:hypothetical protein